MLRHPNYYKKNYFLLPSIRMSGKNINFEDKQIKKRSFYKNKKLFKVEDIDVNKILLSKKDPYGANKSIKYFIEYNDDDVIRALCIKLPQMIGYVKCFVSNKTMSFKVTNKKTVKKLHENMGKQHQLFNGSKIW